MMTAINNLGAGWSDFALLAFAAILFGALGALVAYLASVFWFRRWTQRSAQEDKLADTAHTSLLGFAAFVLALAITNVFSNFARTEEAVRLEALEIRRLDRELEPLGAAATDARKALVAYVADVAKDEWPRLALRPNSLSPRAEQDLDDVWRGVRATQAAIGPDQSHLRDTLSLTLTQIEKARAGRLAAATNSIPDVFWPVIVAFVVAASFMSGRNAHKTFGMQMNVLHMSAVGIVIALIMILDNPFRGETSVPAEMIATALKPLG
ncbi:MAG: DUF4239 domain-containing protein [Beijerinckiaceae bacterium]